MKTGALTDAAHDDTSFSLTNQRTRAILGKEANTPKDEHDTTDLFPSKPASGVDGAALSSHDADPLVGPANTDATYFGSEPALPDTANALHQPIDLSQPVDHIDWHLSGLIS